MAVCAERRAVICRRERVEAVLEHVEIKRAQIHYAEIVQRVEDAMKFEAVITLAALADQFGRAREHPAIDFPEVRIGQGVALRIEVGQIAGHEAERVADLAIGLGELRHDVVRHAHVGRVVLRGDPQTQQVGAPFVADLGGQHDVAQRFRHRPALFVERPAVRQHVSVRRAAVHADADQQRALEPAAILVGAFQIHVGGPGKIGRGRIRRIEHGQMRRAGIEPDVENVGFLAPAGLAAFRAARARGKQFFRRVRVPGVRAFFLEKGQHVAKRLGVIEQRACSPRSRRR